MFTHSTNTNMSKMNKKSAFVPDYPIWYGTNRNNSIWKGNNNNTTQGSTNRSVEIFIKGMFNSNFGGVDFLLYIFSLFFIATMSVPLYLFRDTNHKAYGRDKEKYKQKNIKNLRSTIIRCDIISRILNMSLNFTFKRIQNNNKD